MKLDPEVVADESAQWLWYPDEAEVIHTDEFLLVKWPDWFAVPPALLRFAPTRAVGHAFARAADAVRDWGHAELVAWAKLDAPDGFEELLRERGTLDETLDVFALDLSAGAPALDVPEDLEIAWREDLTSSRDFVAVGMAAFAEGTMPTDDVLLAHARESEQDRIAGRGGQMVVRRAGESIGAAGLAMAGSTARLWGSVSSPMGRSGPTSCRSRRVVSTDRPRSSGCSTTREAAARPPEGVSRRAPGAGRGWRTPGPGRVGCAGR